MAIMGLYPINLFWIAFLEILIGYLPKKAALVFTKKKAAYLK